MAQQQGSQFHWDTQLARLMLQRVLCFISVPPDCLLRVRTTGEQFLWICHPTTPKRSSPPIKLVARTDLDPMAPNARQEDPYRYCQPLTHKKLRGLRRCRTRCVAPLKEWDTDVVTDMTMTMTMTLKESIQQLSVAWLYRHE